MRFNDFFWFAFHFFHHVRLLLLYDAVSKCIMAVGRSFQRGDNKKVNLIITDSGIARADLSGIKRKRKTIMRQDTERFGRGSIE